MVLREGETGERGEAALRKTHSQAALGNDRGGDRGRALGGDRGALGDGGEKG